MLNTVLISFLSLFISFHNFHVTQTTLHYNNSSDLIEITIQVAVQDLESALEDQGAKQLRIGTDNESKSTDQLIKDYFERRLIILPNGKPTHYQWVGKEMSKDLHDLYIYVEITNCQQYGKFTSLSVENSIFTEILSDQANIVSIEFGADNQKLTFSQNNKKQTVKLGQ
ncbi:MAG: hypothetical protein HRT71_20200 [Flavobacteriales bacterium]|nr:hypothetical protein [Flavobacteriales bacterium]